MPNSRQAVRAEEEFTGRGILEDPLYNHHDLNLCVFNL